MTTGIGVVTDMKIYNEELQAGYIEGITQNVNLFNAASNNVLQLTSKALLGDYLKEAFFTRNGSLITRQDLTSTSAATAQKYTQDENITVKVNRKIGPVDMTLNALRRAGMTDQEFSLLLGQKIGEEMVADQINSIISAVAAAVGGVAGLVHDVSALSSANSVSHKHLNKMMSKMGDKSGQIAAFIAQGLTAHDLIGQAITDNMYQVGGVTVISGSVATFGRPLIMTDADGLQGTSGSSSTAFTTRKVLGLVPGAGMVTESESPVVTARIVDGLEQLVARTQGEYAYNLEVKGFKWKVATGNNPTSAAIGTSANWTQTASNIKDCAGVLGVFKDAA